MSIEPPSLIFVGEVDRLGARARVAGLGQVLGVAAGGDHHWRRRPERPP
jgi:hypothetical protein